jgi:hypothetical protein
MNQAEPLTAGTIDRETLGGSFDQLLRLFLGPNTKYGIMELKHPAAGNPGAQMVFVDFANAIWGLTNGRTNQRKAFAKASKIRFPLVSPYIS